MSKRNLLIIAGVVVIVLLVVGGFFVIKNRGAQTNPTPIPEAPTPSDQPILTATPTPDSPLISGACPSQWIGLPDSDNDGLPDTVEAMYKTDPNNPDTDGDGYKDGQEALKGYDPLVPGSARLDSDKDDLLDNEECQYGTDPFNPDTDGDGHSDGSEVKNGYDPLKPGNARLNPTNSTPIVAFPTPTPSGLVFNNSNPTPFTTPAAASLNTGNTPATAPTTLATFVKVSRTELTIAKTNTKADIKAYLTAFDQSSPSVLVGGTSFTDALAAAFNGDNTKLGTALNELTQYERDLLKLSTPEAAVNHQILMVSLTRSVNQQLSIIYQQSGKDTQKQLGAASALQQILSNNLTALQTERQKLDAAAK